MIRAFIALTLPSSVRDALAALQRELAQPRADVKWVEPDHLHVTLKFLGEITDEQRQAIEAMLRRVAAQEQPFSLSVEGVGAFPSLESPRVIWVGLAEGKEAATRLAQRIEEEGKALSLRQEARSFSAHITLGRVRSPRNRQGLTQALRAARLKIPPPWRATSLTLYQSVLSSTGPTYRVVAEIPLKGADGILIGLLAGL